MRRYVVSFPPATVTMPSGPVESVVSRSARTVSAAPSGSTRTPAKRARTAPRAAGSSASCASARICCSSASVGWSDAGVALERRVGRPQQEHLGPGHGERNPAAVDRDRQRRSPTPVPLEDEVGATAQRHGRARACVLEPPNAVDPGAGGVDDGAHPNLDCCPAGRVTNVRAEARLEPHQLGPVEHDAALGGCSAQVCEAEAGVVGLRVRVEARRPQPVQAQRRHQLRRRPGSDHASALRDRAGQAGIRPERAPDRDAPVGPAAIDGEHEVERPDEVRRDDPAEGVHLGQRLADEAEVPEAQVAEAAVHELRGGARRAGGEVVALDEGDAETVTGSQFGDPRADDPTPDDEQVEPLSAQALEGERT